MQREYTRHLSEEQITWAIIDQDELPESAKEHLAGCALCLGKVKAMERSLEKIGDLANKFVPPAYPRPIASREAAKASAQGTMFGFRRLGLSFALAAIVVVIVGGGLFLRGYRHDRQMGAIREEVLGDVALIAEVNKLIENPLPPVYNEISPENCTTVDQGFMDFIIPGLGSGNRDPGSA